MTKWRCVYMMFLKNKDYAGRAECEQHDNQENQSMVPGNEKSSGEKVCKKRDYQAMMWHHPIPPVLQTSLLGNTRDWFKQESRGGIHVQARCTFSLWNFRTSKYLGLCSHFTHFVHTSCICYCCVLIKLSNGGVMVSLTQKGCACPHQDIGTGP